MTIVYAYNRWDYNGKEVNTHEEALELGEIDVGKYSVMMKNKNKYKELLATGKAVAMNLDAGDHLVHAGSSSADTKYKEFGGSDTTSKSDLYGPSAKFQFSLKKSGDSGSGAQLMSAASNEAVGVLNYAIRHWENNGGDEEFRNSASSKKAFKILGAEMKATARSKMFVYVGKAKKLFGEFWMSNKNPRYQVIEKAVKNYKIDKDGYIDDENYNIRVAAFKSKKASKLQKIDKKRIIQHLKGELAFSGQAEKFYGSEAKHLIKSHNKKGFKNQSFIEPPSATAIEKIQDKFKGDTAIGVGKAKMSAKHLDKIAASDKTPSILRGQVIDVMETAIKGKVWQEQLLTIFNKSDDLKKWIVYEAASGLGKFTGKTSSGKKNDGTSEAVANTMLVFNQAGSILKNQPTLDYAMANGSLVDTLSISYKGSGTARYIKMGISSGVEYDNPSMITEEDAKEISTTLDNIIDTELIKYEGAVYQLNEGFLDKVKDMYGSVVDRAKDYVAKAKELLFKLYDNIIEKFINKIIEWAGKGITYLMEILGFKVDGTVSIATPSW
jgi:hypothetical protein